MSGCTVGRRYRLPVPAPPPVPGPGPVPRRHLVAPVPVTVVVPVRLRYSTVGPPRALRAPVGWNNNRPQIAHRGRARCRSAPSSVVLSVFILITVVGPNGKAALSTRATALYTTLHASMYYEYGRRAERCADTTRQAQRATLIFNRDPGLPALLVAGTAAEQQEAVLERRAAGPAAGMASIQLDGCSASP